MIYNKKHLTGNPVLNKNMLTDIPLGSLQYNISFLVIFLKLTESSSLFSKFLRKSHAEMLFRE